MVSWDVVGGAVSYEVELSDTSGNVMAVKPVAGSSISMGDLIDGAAVVVGSVYKVRVRAISPLGPGIWSIKVQFTLEGLPAPANVVIM
jgi:hypothetical protein